MGKPGVRRRAYHSMRAQRTNVGVSHNTGLPSNAGFHTMRAYGRLRAY